MHLSVRLKHGFVGHCVHAHEGLICVLKLMLMASGTTVVQDQSCPNGFSVFIEHGYG